MNFKVCWLIFLVLLNLIMKMPFFLRVTAFGGIWVIECHNLWTALWDAGCKSKFWFASTRSLPNILTASWVFSLEVVISARKSALPSCSYSVSTWLNQQGGTTLDWNVKAVFPLKPVRFCKTQNVLSFPFIPSFYFFPPTWPSNYTGVYFVRRRTNDIFKFLYIQTVHTGPSSQGGRQTSSKQECPDHFPRGDRALWASAFFHRDPAWQVCVDRVRSLTELHRCACQVNSVHPPLRMARTLRCCVQRIAFGRNPASVVTCVAREVVFSIRKRLCGHECRSGANVSK